MKFSIKEILACIVAVVLGIITGGMYLMSIMIIIGIIFLPVLPIYLILVALAFYGIGKNGYLLPAILYNVSVLVLLNLFTGLPGLVYTNLGSGQGVLGVLMAILGGIIFSAPAYLLALILHKRKEQMARLASASSPISVTNATPPDGLV